MNRDPYSGEQLRAIRHLPRLGISHQDRRFWEKVLNWRKSVTPSNEKKSDESSSNKG